MQAYTSAMHKFGVEAAAPSPPTGRAPPPQWGCELSAPPDLGKRLLFILGAAWGLSGMGYYVEQ